MNNREKMNDWLQQFCVNHHLNKGEFCIAKHKKTGNYYVLYKNPIVECTNGQEDIKKVLYTNSELWFCREQEEFNQKFELA